jgi:hypothetical protein
MEQLTSLHPLFLMAWMVNTFIAFVVCVTIYEKTIRERRMTVRSFAVLVVLLCIGWAIAALLR